MARGGTIIASVTDEVEDVTTVYVFGMGLVFLDVEDSDRNAIATGTYTLDQARELRDAIDQAIAAASKEA